MVVQSANTVSEALVDELLSAAHELAQSTPLSESTLLTEPLCALSVLCGKKSVLIRANLSLPKGDPWLNLFCLTTYDSTSVENSLQIDLFMQNKPNFRKAHNELNSIPEKELRKIFTPSNGEKQTQSKPNQTQSTPVFSPLRKNKPNSNPNQTQNKPNFSSSATSRAQTPSNRGLIFKRPARVETYDATRKITYRSKR